MSPPIGGGIPSVSKGQQWGITSKIDVRNVGNGYDRSAVSPTMHGIFTAKGVLCYIVAHIFCVMEVHDAGSCRRSLSSTRIGSWD